MRMLGDVREESRRNRQRGESRSQIPEIRMQKYTTDARDEG
jgi:hypothetical protein